MKICPDCAFANEERFPTCILCYTSLANARSRPHADPNHPEHAARALQRKRRWITRRQLAWAAVCHTAVITGTAVCPGFVSDQHTLILYAAGAVVVALAVLDDLAGTLLSGILQGAASVVILLYFGPVQPFSFYMLAGHSLAAMLFGCWVEMIHSATH